MENLSAILSEASRLRRRIPCRPACRRNPSSRRISQRPQEDSVQWAARASHDQTTGRTSCGLCRISNISNNTVRKSRCQNVFFFFYNEAEQEQPPVPILYSEWIRGEPIIIWNSQIPSSKRQVLLNDLAEFLLQLWTTPAPPPPPLHPSAAAQNPLSNYSTWLTQSLDRGVRRTLAGTARWGDAMNYLIMRSMIPKYAAEVDRYSDFGFAHGDLNANNILRSGDFHLTG